MKGLRWRWRVGKGRRGSFGSSGEEARCPIFCALYKPRERERGGWKGERKGFVIWEAKEAIHIATSERERESRGFKSGEQIQPLGCRDFEIRIAVKSLRESSRHGGSAGEPSHSRPCPEGQDPHLCPQPHLPQPPSPSRRIQRRFLYLPCRWPTRSRRRRYPRCSVRQGFGASSFHAPLFGSGSCFAFWVWIFLWDSCFGFLR